MGLAIFYDPCSRCEHKDTKKMCNMCVLTYLRNAHKNDFLEPEPIIKSYEDLISNSKATDEHEAQKHIL